MKHFPTYFNRANQRINFNYLKGISLAEAIYASNLEMPKHTHPHAGFCLVLRGEYTESDGNTLLECNPLCVKFNPAGDIHSNRYGAERVHIFVTEIKSDWLIHTGATDLIGDSPMVFSNNSITWLMMKLRREFNSGDVEAAIAIEGLMLELIAETSRKRARIIENKQPRWLIHAKECLDDEFPRHLTLSDIAAFVGVHPVYLANSFRRHYGCSIGEYLRKKRIEFACHKLAKSKDELVDIALAAGFSNQSHFSRIFKQITGMTPAKYRAVNQMP